MSVGSIFESDENIVTVCSHSGEAFFNDDFDSAVKAMIFREEAAKQINQALEKPVDHLNTTFPMK